MKLIDQTLVDSWKRSRKYAASIDKAKDAILEAHELKLIREKHEQFVKRLHGVVHQLGKSVKRNNAVVVLSDPEGILLKTVGDPTYLQETEKIYLKQGAQWSESIHGTNSAGTAAVEERAIAVVGSDHYLQSHHNIYCVGSPIFDSSGKLKGVLNMSGHVDQYDPSFLRFVDIVARKIENELLMEEREGDTIISLQSERNLNFEALIALDKDGCITSMNRAAKEILPINEHPEEITIQFPELFSNYETLLDQLTSQPTFQIINVKSKSFNENFIATLVRNKTTKQTYFQKKGSKESEKNIASGIVFPHIIGSDKKFVACLRTAKKVASTNYPISITGESGTGKDILSYAIHQASDRKDGPFVALNCGGITKSLVESELFGYEAGAFTGAKREGHAGVFERANGGTLFLDEIAELPLDIQATLLRVLQDFKVMRVGGKRPIEVDIRLITATHTNLWDKVQAGTFRDDLFYRLQGVQIELPPLRERQDILDYAHYFLKEIATELKVSSFILTDDAKELIQDYAWPGNVRQLKSALREAAFLADELMIQAKHFPTYIKHAQIKNTHTKSLLEEVEVKTIRKVLKENDGNISKSARILGIGRNTLYRKINQFRIHPSDI